MKILVCDDDKEIVEAIEIYLKFEGYEVLKAYDGLQAKEVVESSKIDLIVMDIMMPNMDGISALLKIRETNHIPIILLSAKSEDTDKIVGLQMGADDYMTKPFNPMELIARVKSQLRRYTQFGSIEKVSDVFQTGGVVVDDKNKTVHVEGEEVSLTQLQYKILRLLIKNPGRVFSKDEIVEHVWGGENFNSDNTIAVYVRSIREKIEINPKDPKYLKVVWGVGYKIEKI